MKDEVVQCKECRHWREIEPGGGFTGEGACDEIDDSREMGLAGLTGEDTALLTRPEFGCVLGEVR